MTCREVMESQMHKLEQDAWVRASELKSLHKEHETLVEDNKRLSQQAETLRAAKDRLIEEKTSVMMKLAEVESELHVIAFTPQAGKSGALRAQTLQNILKLSINHKLPQIIWKFTIT